MIDRNRDTIPYQRSNPSDVSLSHWEYHDFIDQLLDDRLTAEGLMKFKRLHSQMAVNAVLIPAVTFPIAFIANRWLAGTQIATQDSLIEEWHLQDIISWAWVSSGPSSCTGVSQGQSPASFTPTLSVTPAQMAPISAKPYVLASPDFGIKFLTSSSKTSSTTPR